MSKAKDKVIEEHEEELYVELTKDELLTRGHELAEQEEEQHKHASHSKLVRSELKAQEEAIGTKLSDLAEVVRKGKELRQVKVRSIAKFEESVVLVQRVDTGGVVRSRPLTDHERQDGLFGGAKDS